MCCSCWHQSLMEGKRGSVQGDWWRWAGSSYALVHDCLSEAYVRSKWERDVKREEGLAWGEPQQVEVPAKSPCWWNPQVFVWLGTGGQGEKPQHMRLYGPW